MNAIKTTGTSKTIAKRRVGRPRATGRESATDAREDILRAAARLFAERGFVGTSTKAIATAVGLRQSAIFHWFPNKEAILESLFSQGWDRSYAYFTQVQESNLSGAAKLCLCLMYDAVVVADADPYIQLMMVPPELRQPKFRYLLEKREALISKLEECIRQAITEGDFRRIDSSNAAHMVLAVDEVILDAAARKGRTTPEAHAEMVVDFALHALMLDPTRIPTIRDLADKYARSL